MIFNIVFSLLLLLLMPCVSITSADTFGNGANSFDIEFVTIGNPGNDVDATGKPNPAGKVEYTYRIGKYEISENMVDNANAAGLLNITHNNRGANKPATSISWFEAAQFVNWLNLDKGSSPAYKFDSGGNYQVWTASDPGYDPNNHYRNTQSQYFLPSTDEWYKAAYYDPAAEVYYDYPTGTDSVPDGMDFTGDPVFDAVITDLSANPGTVLGPNDITDVGLLSPYGTAGQGGNAGELEETESNPLNNLALSDRGFRGGMWDFDTISMLSTSRGSIEPSRDDLIFGSLGFRVASRIPEPSTLLLGALGCLGVLMRRRR